MPYLHILNFNDLIIIIQLMLTEVKPRVRMKVMCQSFSGQFMCPGFSIAPNELIN